MRNVDCRRKYLSAPDRYYLSLGEGVTLASHILAEGAELGVGWGVNKRRTRWMTLGWSVQEEGGREWKKGRVKKETKAQADLRLSCSNTAGRLADRSRAGVMVTSGGEYLCRDEFCVRGS